MQKKYGFVVLNYKNYAETIACVDSIAAIPGDDYFIVIVDNESPNESYQVLQEKFANRANVQVVRSGRNGGYSFGNNCGIRFLATIGICDVIIATSDTLVVSTDILEQLARLDAPDVGVVGPRVANLGGDMQNPMLPRVNASYIINIHFPRLAGVIRNTVYAWRRLVATPVRRGPRPPDNHQGASDVYMVHGCFLYLSSYYLKTCGLLDESLFMYGEEDLLAFNCYAHGLRTLYAPAISVIHKEAQSTPQDSGNSFFALNSKKSNAYLKRQMKLFTLLSQSLQRRGAR